MAESIGHWDNNDWHSIDWNKTHNPRPQASIHAALNEQSLEAIREIVRQSIQWALQPELNAEAPRYPLITKSHIGIQVRFTDFGGQEYEGVLYPTKIDNP